MRAIFLLIIRLIGVIWRSAVPCYLSLSSSSYILVMTRERNWQKSQELELSRHLNIQIYEPSEGCPLQGPISCEVF